MASSKQERRDYRSALLLTASVLSCLALASHALLRSESSVIEALLVLGGVALGARTLVVGRRRSLPEASRIGAYTLDGKLGEGGMGVVYKAHHDLLERPAAIKFLSHEREPAAEARFEQEVQLTSRLTHPNTISIYDFGRTPRGQFFYVMEWIDGMDLQSLVKREGRLPPARVAYLLAQVCGALSEAHELGLIHRDVKPANVMVCQRGRQRDVVKLLDFGLIERIGAGARLRDESPDTVVGTPLYLAPETLTAPERVDARSDLYAVGALDYFLLTGAAPFSGKSALDIFAQHLKSEPVSPSRRVATPIPAPLEALILSCLRKSPDERPHSARALQREFERLAASLRERPAAAPVDVPSARAA
ncbi:MAG: serine/threonine protein kinase [Myxococcales bacterium]|nr:serine/threonine protein kinase [Myxococcales bacterium]